MNEQSPAAPSAGQRILVPLDGSEQSRSAIPYAQTLAGTNGALILLTVVPSADELTVDDGAPLHAALEIAATELRQAGQTAETQVLVGDPAEQIVAAATTDGAALIAIGSHGRGAIGRLIHGSVADKVAREAAVPVLVVRAAPTETGPAAVNRLVVPLDGSTLSEGSLPVATALAKRLAVPLALVRAVNIAEFMPPAVGMGEAIPFDVYDQTQAELEQDARQYLDAQATKLREAGFTVETHVLSGPPAAAIAEATKPGDVIVLVSNERSGVVRWLMGSVAEELVHRDDAPVILVPATESGA